MKPHDRRWSVPVIAAASVFALTSPFSAQAATSSKAPAPPSAATADHVPAGEHTVTLITGDVVNTRQSPGADRKPGGTVTVRGADGLPARTRIMTSGDDLYVYPESALPFVAQGALDRQLFNITDLIADGFDDAHRDRLPLIVSYTQAGAAHRASAVPEGAARVRNLDSIQGAALTADRSRADDFWKSVAGAAANDGARTRNTHPSFGGGISHIWLDAPIHAALADSTAQIGAPQVWQGGDTGQGVDVAVLDTGVDAGHPDLADRIATRQSFVPDENTDDHAGHGTHVASIIAGTGAASGGKEKGVAPGARLRIGKVLDNHGSGQISYALAGMEWAAVDQHAKVINMSLGTSQVSDGTDPMSRAVDRLSAQTGALFVVAAGNFGEDPSTIVAPGAATSALTVGAVDSTDSLATFSSRGPRVDGALKPEITAPGVDILAANSQFIGNDQGAYQSMSGTSMATPHVAGAAALLAAAHPDLTGSQLKDLLASSSRQTPTYDAFEAGSGRLDAAAAAQAGVFASATAFAAQYKGGALQRPVTYTNVTDAPVALSLSVEAAHAPSGMFSLSASEVVVPAHGSAKVTVTIDGSSGTVKEHYSGQVLATDTAGRTVAHTAVSLGFATMHKLTLTFKDSEGNPTSGEVMLVKAGSKDPFPIGVGPSGTEEIFVPDDVYSALSYQEVQGAHGPHSRGLALLGDPDVLVDRDMTVTFDASKVKRIDMTTPQRSDVTFQKLGCNRVMNGVRSGLSAESVYYDSIWAQPTTHKVTHGDFQLTARWRGEKPALAVSTRTTEFTGILRQEGITPLARGTYKLPLVFADQGSSADYAHLDAHGKAVVVRHSDDVSDMDQAASAIAAGAKLMLVVENGYGRPMRSYAPLGQRPVALDVGLLGTEEGEKLIRQAEDGGTRITVDSETASPYVYDLAHAWHNEIPSKMTVKNDTNNLARIDVTFASPKPDVPGAEFRFEWLDGVDWSSGPIMPEPANGKRTDWVSTSGVRWHQEAFAESIGFEEGAKTAYRAGSRQSEEWFKPIQRPFLNDAFFNNLPPTRNGSLLYIDIPAWGSSNHVGWNQDPAVTQQQTLYQGNTQLGQGNFTNVWGNAPSRGKLPYKLVVTGERDVAYTPYSSRTRTEWDFTSAQPTDAATVVLPLVQLDYRIGTDAAGRAGRHDTLSVTAAHLPGASLTGKLGAVGLELSYDDGRTWHKAVCGTDGRFRLDAPNKASFVSLRASAKDSAGNAIHQTVIRAFGLR
ncbi:MULTISPECIES: S8 family serine peptidase [unclassified Streptomyces]|uniref:S8 family serine peptidase n=1 Tax=unclassified Streptomyces TaxID=2593676 RepID=UPI002DDBAE1B|nr:MULTISPECIES: S8 family serine peptidase [unclassified Streptomyces]WSC41595.1 S8 family serine peptidase [Streptomyces sp. NBC_01763]